jgi:hypothetical protein
MEDQEEHQIIDGIPIEMQIREHIIYHIPGVKVGCTVNLKMRKTQYPEGTVIEILEIIKCTTQVAGDREWEWADKLGYERGLHYAEYNWNVKLTHAQRIAAGNTGGYKTVELRVGIHAMTPEQRAEWTSKAGRRAAELGLGIHAATPEKLSEWSRKAFEGPNHVSKTASPEQKIEWTSKGGRKALAGPNHNTKQVLTCPHPNCGFTGTGFAMYRWHFDKCKWKKKP